jgi:hypothetical protein
LEERRLGSSVIIRMSAIRKLATEAADNGVHAHITANTRLDSRAAASELGIHLTGIDEMIKKSLG